MKAKYRDNVTLPQVGDIIESPLFVYGHWDSEMGKPNARLYVNGEDGDHRCRQYIPEDERVATAARTGKVPPKERIIDYGANDPTRATSRFVVEEAYRESDSTGMSRGDTFSGDWEMICRRLKPNGRYDPDGERIHVSMDGDGAREALDRSIRIVGHLDRVFV